MNVKTAYVLMSAMNSGWAQSPPLSETSACPPKQKRKKIKGWQKKRRKA